MSGRVRYRTQFCFIAPALLLDRYASASTVHLILPQIKDPKYIEFYQRKRREGDIIILDNGAYELKDSVADDNLVEAIKLYRPTITALPDFLLQDGDLTFQAAKKFWDKYNGEFETEWMYIPQAEPGDLQGWYRNLNKARKYFKGVSWFGLPRALCTHIARGPNAWLARADACEFLAMQGMKCHALGMNAGDLRELEALFWEGCVSVDSSAPVWRGLANRRLDSEEDHLWWKNHGTEVDFSWNGLEGPRAQPFHDSVVKHNMNLVLRTVRQREIK